MTETFPAAPQLEFAMTITLGKIYWVKPTQYGSERSAVSAVVLFVPRRPVARAASSRAMA